MSQKHHEIPLALIGDIAFNEDRTPHGNKVSVGGAAYYALIGASLFCENVGLVAKVGTDFDLHHLDPTHANTRGIQVEDGETCRFVLTQHANNTRDFTAERGVAATVDTAHFPPEYKTARFLHLATQLPQHALEWLKYLSGHGSVSVDAFESFVLQHPEETKLMLNQADIIFLNEAEYEQLGATYVRTLNKPIVLKRGDQGATMRLHGENISVNAPQVLAVETTGAGDVLAGALLAQLALGVSPGQALHEAVQIASKSVTDFGVEHIRKERA